ncbi:MAG TPA: fumarylacetoacetate hydrolase family protein [Candidatus Dormibacteraeota bacterium]|jgi:2-keto-4-pentenoate hydratase/2-oxohepta-3-ene-1,7-dioic acid hydratase in catechol pathway|nr:fumarylacetoacetate hydrolase family protein [Candidatus Dormibacteraeota bacterium]
MKLVMFKADGSRRLGALRPGSEDEVVEISDPADLRTLIDAGDAGLSLVRSALSSSRSKSHRLADLELLAPLDPPRGNVIAIGRNYQKHAEETAHGGKVSPPTIFTKAITSLTEPFADITIDPAISDQIDWEVELAVLIGKGDANIKRARAMDHVFGYTVLNDVTARDIQSGWGGQYFKGKSLDRSCPTGPWVVTKDEVEDPQALKLFLRVNGTVKQEGDTRDMIYPVDAIIEWVSKGMTLLPGSLIATGTPDGVGFARTPPEFLKPGDVMESEVQGIGLLRNRIVAAVG